MLRRIDLAWRGPETRCRETAEALGLDAVADPALADLDLAAWRGRPLPEVPPEALQAWMTDPHAAPHGGETLADLLIRVPRWLSDLPGGRIAAVTHPAVIRAAVLYVLGAPPASFWRIDIAPLSQTRLSRHGGRWQLNETGHAL